MALFEPRKGANDIYVFDLARGVRSRLTAGLANNKNPVWSPSGNRVVFSSDGDGMYDIYARADDGATPAQAIWKGGDDKTPSAFSPDGKWLLAGQYSAKTDFDLWLLPANGEGKPQLLIGTEEQDGEATFSPDGSWILYSSGAPGHGEIYVRHFPTGRSVQVSTNGGSFPWWSTDGSEIYFGTTAHDMYAVPFRATGSTPALGKPALLFHRSKGLRFWQPSHKPGRFLGATPSAPEESIQVVNYVTGWSEKLPP